MAPPVLMYVFFVVVMTMTGQVASLKEGGVFLDQASCVMMREAVLGEHFIPVTTGEVRVVGACHAVDVSTLPRCRGQ